MELLKQNITEFSASNIVETVATWDNTIYTAGAFTIGKVYAITTIGTTDFTLIGASANAVGIVFTATGIGTGTGTATTAYLAGQYALLGTLIYKCVSAHTDKSPDANVGIYWVKWQVSNRRAMLDLSAQSKSIFEGGNLTVEFLQNYANAVAIGNYEADTILVEVLDSLNAVLWSYETPSTLNENVLDYWDYIYEPYGYESDRAMKINLGYDGYKVRVTFKKSAESTRTACGYLVVGTPYSMGCTMDKVGFKFNSYAVKNTDAFGTLSIIKRAVQDVVDFETLVDHTELSTMRRKIKEIYNDILVFIVDESETTKYENLLTLGTVESSNVILTEFDKTVISWSVVEAI